MNTKIEVATAKFQEGYNCAQSVFYSFCDILSFDKDLALKMVCGFGAGMARTEEVCGAVSGGIVVLGVKYGRGENEDRSATELTYRKTNRLLERFTETHGTYICRKLIDYIDLKTDEGQQQYKDKDMHKKICAPCIQSVVEIVEELIESNENPAK